MLDDSLRRNWVAQVAQERAQKAREHGRRTYDEDVEPKPFERSRWLGLQVRSLLALVAVAEEGSFVGAARRLGYSRSTISHQIAQLEAAVGASLLVRGSGSRSVLGDAGRPHRRRARARRAAAARERRGPARRARADGAAQARAASRCGSGRTLRPRASARSRRHTAPSARVRRGACRTPRETSNFSTFP